MSSVLRVAASFLILSVLASACAAQLSGPSGNPGDMVLHAYALKHRKAGDALPLVSSLLSRQGTVELQPRTNTLVIRDTMAALREIVKTLNSYDHPPRPLTLELYIVRAGRAAASEARSGLPASYTQRLSALLRYNVFDVKAQALLASQEEQAVTYAVGRDYEISFRVGTVDASGLVKLSNFRFSKRNSRGGQPQLILQAAYVNPRLDQMTSLGVAPNEASPQALMIVMVVHAGEAGRRPVQRAEQ